MVHLVKEASSSFGPVVGVPDLAKSFNILTMPGGILLQVNKIDDCLEGCLQNSLAASHHIYPDAESLESGSLFKRDRFFSPSSRLVLGV